MRHALKVAALLTLPAAEALAAEVIWLSPPTPAMAESVAAQAGATHEPLQPLDLRYASSAWSDADARTWTALDEALIQVRAFETRLDGELVIMRDLQRPIQSIAVVRDERDAGRLHAALAYQGFAVNRYFEDTLGTDSEAEPYREWLDNRWVERPWLDAIALAPDKVVTPYDIAEAPQRVAYNEAREVVLGALPATLVPFDLPDGARLVVDGRAETLDAAGGVKVVPGRHLVHAAVEERIVARWDLRVSPGEEVALEVPVSDAVWRRFLRELADGAAVPAALVPSVEALGGEVWVARPVGSEVEVFALTGDGISRVEPVRQAKAEVSGGLSWTAGALAGWMASHDFYLQDPRNAPHSVATVNTATVGLALGADYDRGLLRIGAGLDAHFTPGPHHTARYGDSGDTRIRPHAYLAAGLRPVQATVGFLAPWHPTLGLRLTAPLTERLELRGSAVTGLKRTLARPDLSTYDTGDLFAITAGLAVRL